jgi:hypothetical protein
MIVFVAQSTSGIEVYLRTHGAPIADMFRVCTYDELFRSRRRHPGTYCFADIERLSDEQRARAGVICDDLVASGTRVLNHPARSMRRYDLLRMLRERGTNHFDVRRVGESMENLRFPVFVRGENDHRGSRTPLLATPHELERAIADLRARGESDADLVVEFLDTADQDGTYRKYAAFVVGDRVLARHLFASDEWMLKSAKRKDEQTRLEELEYVTTNPHADTIRDIATAANISYGRIDYSLLDGAVQVWEFNTNPMIAGRWVQQSVSAPQRSAVSKLAGRLLRPAARRLPSVRAARQARREVQDDSGPRAEVHAAFASEMSTAWVDVDQGRAR